MIEENIVIIKKSKQGNYKDPEKRKEYKKIWARNKAPKQHQPVVQPVVQSIVQSVVQPVVQPIVQSVVQLTVEKNQSFLCVQFYKLRKFRKDHDLKDYLHWLRDIRYVNNEFKERYEKKIFRFNCNICGIRVLTIFKEKKDISICNKCILLPDM